MRNITIALIVVIGVLGGFYSGWKYSQSKVQANTTAVAATNSGGSGFGGAGGGFGGGAGITGASGASGAGGARGAGGGAFGAGTTGQVVSFANGVLTIKDRSGNNVKVNLSGQTPILKTATASTSDLTPGTTVTIVGTTGTDGTVDARAVTIGAARGAGG